MPAPAKKRSFLDQLYHSKATQHMLAGVGVALVSALPGVLPAAVKPFGSVLATLLLGSGIFHAAQEGPSDPPAAS